jgi:hypothetical protein
VRVIFYQTAEACSTDLSAWAESYKHPNMGDENEKFT